MHALGLDVGRARDYLLLISIRRQSSVKDWPFRLPSWQPRNPCCHFWRPHDRRPALPCWWSALRERTTRDAPISAATCARPLAAYIPRHSRNAVYRPGSTARQADDRIRKRFCLASAFAVHRHLPRSGHFHQFDVRHLSPGPPQRVKTAREQALGDEAVKPRHDNGETQSAGRKIAFPGFDFGFHFRVHWL